MRTHSVEAEHELEVVVERDDEIWKGWATDEDDAIRRAGLDTERDLTVREVLR